MDPKEMIGEVARMVRRRLPLAVPIVVVGLGVAVAVALTRPPSYEARAKILVERPRVADDLARSTVNLSAAARLQLIEEQLMARDNLAEMMDRWALFDLPGIAREKRLDLVRGTTRIESIGVATGQSNPWSGGGGEGLFAFTITVTLDDPAKAAAIANEFATEAVTRDRAARTGQAEETRAYFEAENRRLSDAVAAKEAEVAAFKQAHADSLPESMEARRAALGRLRENMLGTDRRVMELQEKLADLDAAAAGERSLDNAAGADPAETKLRELELALSAKQGTLAANHPEIRQLRDQIAAVKALLGSGDKGRSGETSPETGLAAERKAAIARQSAQVTAQIEQLGAERAEMTAEASALETSIRATPEVGVALDALARALSELQATQTDVAKRYAEARAGAELEASQQSERFEIVERAEVPEIPASSDRKKIVALGAAGSLAVAGGLALMLEFLNSAPRSAAAMERQLGIRPVVSIPYVYAPGERGRGRLRWAVLALGLGLGLVLGLPVVDRTVVPLRPIAARLANAAGLGALLPPAAEDPASRL